MRIGIDISSIVFGTGVSRYTANLTRALVKHYPEDQFVFYGGSLRNFIALRNFPRAATELDIPDQEASIYPIPPKIQSLLFNRLHLPIETFTQNLDIFHSWDWYTPATIKTKLVTTIHDLSAIKYPQDTHPEIVAHHQRSLSWIKKDAAAIIAVSEATKQDIVNLLNISPNRIKVIYEALPQELEIDVNPETCQSILGKYGLKKPYFLAVASLEPRKNINRIIKAWQPLKKDYQLVLVGKPGFQEIKPQSGLVMTGYIDALDLAGLYQQAACLVYASIYEGFGLPILEAFYHRTPVVTSSASSMPEVAGSAAVLVDPLDVDSIHQGIKKVIANSSSYVSKGTRQLKKFSWRKVASQTMKLYESVHGH